MPEDEAAHLGRVLRLRPGAPVRVFDGAGREWHAEVADVRPHGAAVRVIEPVPASPEWRAAVTLVVAVLKGEKMDDVIRDAVMMGVCAVQPIISARTEISAAALGRSGRVDRWKRIAISSAKQCGRAVVPRVPEAMSFDAWLTRAPATSEMRLMLVEPLAQVNARRLRELPAPDRVSLAIGPEGGWTSDEIATATAAEVVPIRLGARTLRADAVPLVALAVCQSLWEDI